MKWRTKRTNWLLSILCVAALLLPTQSMLAQEPTDGDIVETADAVMEENVVGDAESDDGQTAPEASPELTNFFYLPLIQGTNSTADANVEAAEATFTRSWFANTCTNVATSERGLWDDMAGAGVNNESGLFWLLTNSSLNEQCSYYSSIAFPGVSTTTYPKLRVRAAVNDSARLYVYLYRFNTNGTCGTYLTGLATGVADDHSGFVTLTISLPVGYRICQVRIDLTDDPDSNTGYRTSALIDDIRLHTATNVNSYGWVESFTRN